jgi:UDP-glucose 4-epimerase
MKTKILITGVAGFIGSNLAKHFLKNKSILVYGIDNFSTGYKSNIPKGVRFIKGDLSDKKILKKLNFKCDYIFHFAGQSSGEKSFEDPLTDIKNNSLTTINILDYAKKTNIKKIIYASSMSVYGDSKKGYFNENSKLKPKSYYGISKKTSEEYLKLSSKKVPYIILRLFNIYGSGQDLKNLKQGMISIYLSQATRTKKIIIKGPLGRFRDFVIINDLCLICEEIINKKNINNKVINIGTGRKTTVKKIISIIQKYSGKKKIVLKKNTPGDQYGVYANNYLMKKYFKTKLSINLDQEIKKFYEWAKNA